MEKTRQTGAFFDINDKIAGAGPAPMVKGPPRGRIDPAWAGFTGCRPGMTMADSQTVSE